MMQTSAPSNFTSHTLNPVTVLSISYQGAGFYGIQKQRQQRTVMGDLETALIHILGQAPELSMAGRTDRGVHATHQVVAFTPAVYRPDKAYLEGANNLLASDVRIQSVAHLPSDFHPRHSAVSRTYTYVLSKGRYLPSQWVGRACPLGREVDVARMREAASLLIGHHDFSAFRAAGCQSFSPFREIYALTIKETSLWVIVRIVANAYVYRMVRKITQALVYVGAGIWDIERLRNIFLLHDRSVVPPISPYGLYLTDVHYPEPFGDANKKKSCWLDVMLEGDSQ